MLGKAEACATPLPLFAELVGQEQGIAKLDFSAGLFAHDDLNIRLIEAQNLFLIGDGLALENALARLFTRLRMSVMASSSWLQHHGRRPSMSALKR